MIKQIIKQLNKMKSNKFFAMAVLAAAVTMTSCNNDEELNDNNTPVEIRLSSALSVQTRAANPGMDMQIPAGQTVAVYVDEAATPPTKLYGNNILIANGTDGFASGTPMYFPQSGNSVNIYAFHTNATLSDSYPASTTLTHTVEDDQTADAKYYSSDLLYAKAASVSRQATAVNLTFYHLLSKVQIAVKAGDGAPSLDGATITIEGTKLKANFTPDKTTAANAVVITAIGSVTPITVASSLTAGDISTDFTFDDGVNVKYHDAIIVPQTLTAGTEFIKVQLASGGVLSYKIPQSSGVEFLSGRKYLYNISVNLSGLTVTSSIEPWTGGNIEGGDAKMQ
jgi:hypothetical protein